MGARATATHVPEEGEGLHEKKELASRIWGEAFQTGGRACAKGLTRTGLVSFRNEPNRRLVQDFLGGPVGKTLCVQCRGHRFDP